MLLAHTSARVRESRLGLQGMSQFELGLERRLVPDELIFHAEDALASCLVNSKTGSSHGCGPTGAHLPYFAASGLAACSASRACLAAMLEPCPGNNLFNLRVLAKPAASSFSQSADWFLVMPAICVESSDLQQNCAGNRGHQFQLQRAANLCEILLLNHLLNQSFGLGYLRHGAYCLGRHRNQTRNSRTTSRVLGSSEGS